MHRISGLNAETAETTLFDSAIERVRTSPGFFAQDSGQSLSIHPRTALGRFELSTQKSLCLEAGCRKCTSNTRYCGFVLTRTTESAIFSSAAVNRL
jgi:hypothetical protein